MIRYEGKGLGKSNSNYVLYEFDSVRDTAEWALKNADMKNVTGIANRDRRDGFNETEDLQDAVDLAIGGWHASRETVEGVLGPLREKLGKVLGTETVRFHDVTGYEPDIDRYLQGEWECMWDDIHVEAPVNGKVFTVIVDLSISCGNNSEDVLKRGAALIALVEAFTLMGVELELWGELTLRPMGDSSKFDYHTMLTRIARAGEPLDIDTIMFAIGHPDWHRRIGFGFQEGTKEARAFGFYSGRGYGGCMCGSHFSERVNASTVLSIGDSYSEGSKDMLNNPVKFVLDQLEAQGLYEPA